MIVTMCFVMIVIFGGKCVFFIISEKEISLVMKFLLSDLLLFLVHFRRNYVFINLIRVETCLIQLDESAGFWFERNHVIY